MDYKTITREHLTLEKQSYVRDIESYPNFFSNTFKTKNEKFVFEISERRNDIIPLLNFLKNVKVLYGVNSKKYDSLVEAHILSNQNFVTMNYKDICKSINECSQNLINDNYAIIRTLQKVELPFKDIDIKEVSAVFKSLKLVGVSLKHNWIQDLPFPFDKVVKVDEIPLILKYNENDVDITLKWVFAKMEEILMRYELGKIYDVDILSESDSHLANKIFIKYYSERTKQTPDQFKNLRTFRKEIHLKDVIFDNVKFETLALQKMLDTLKSKTVTSTNGLIYPIFKIGNLEINGIGSGGLHSKDKPLTYFANDNEECIDADVSSFYPKEVINSKNWTINGIITLIKPEHLTKDFNDIAEQMTDTRLEAKRNKNTVVSDGLKISVNATTFGKLGADDFMLKDDRALLQVTINGQLHLCMQIERMWKEGIECISANTDGATYIVSKSKTNKFYEICNTWAKELSFDLEYVKYKKIVRRDVNNYITLTDNGKIKAKGDFSDKINLAKGYDSPIVSTALVKYYFDNIPVEKTIREHKDIHDFCIAQKIGSDFNVSYDNREVQHSVRYFVSTKGKSLVKWRIEKGFKKSISLCAGYAVYLLNNIEDNFDYTSLINYDYYIKEALKIKNKISSGDSVDTLF